MGLILQHMSASNDVGNGLINVTGSFALASGSAGTAGSGGLFDLPQVSAVGTPANARGYVFVASSSTTPANSSLWFKSDAGTESDLIGGGAVDGSGAANRLTVWSDGNTVSGSNLNFRFLGSNKDSLSSHHDLYVSSSGGAARFGGKVARWRGGWVAMWLCGKVPGFPGFVHLKT